MNFPKFRRFFFLLIISFALMFTSGFASARNLMVSMAYLPGILENADNGVFVDIIKAIDDNFDGKIARQVFPFPQSLDYVIKGRTDFHLPMIRNKLISTDSLPYDYSTEKMGDVCFVIYSNKDNPVTMETIQAVKNKNPIPLKIKSMGGFLDYFDFPIEEAGSVESGLQEVNFKRIDAFIFAQEECDFTLKRFGLKNVHRSLYDYFDDVFVIPKGERGKEVDKILTECLKKLKATGEMKKLHEKVHLAYQDWQP